MANMLYFVNNLTKERHKMTQDKSNERRVTAWHMSKEVTVSTLIAIILAVGGGVSAYSDINSDIKTLESKVTEATEDRIRKATVVQMFENKDIQIEAVRQDVIKLQKQGDKIEGKIDDQNKLLLEIISKLPRRD